MVAAVLWLLLASPFAVLAAQTTGTIVRRVPRDSIFVRQFGHGTMDTILVLWRALDREQYGSQAWLDLTRKMDSLMAIGPRVMMRQLETNALTVGPGETARGWLGFNAQGPSQYDGNNVTYFAYPSILSVDPESPADHAGIVPGDVLVAFNGTDVVGHQFNLRRLMVPDTKVGVTIRRDGDIRDYSLHIVKVPEGVFERRLAFTRVPFGDASVAGRSILRLDEGRAEQMAMARAAVRARDVEDRDPGATNRGVTPRSLPKVGPLMAGRYLVIAPHAVFGADVSTVGADLARVLHLDKGVLVNDVPVESPAHSAGLRAGDVILAASGQPVATLGQLHDIIVSHFGERAVALQVVRAHKPVKITVTW
jgi:hypothetical protein